jgi:hypothetical protein
MTKPYVRESDVTRLRKSLAALQRHAAERKQAQRHLRYGKPVCDHVEVTLGLGNDAEIRINGVVQS